jgi:hypothetical protein
LSPDVSAIALSPGLFRVLVGWVLVVWVLANWVLVSWELANWVLGICKKEAIFGIPDVLAVETVDGLPRLRLLPTIVKLTSSTSLAARGDKLWKID